MTNFNLFGKKVKKKIPLEHEEQRKVCQYLELKNKLYFAVPNGMFLKNKKSSFGIIKKMKLEGMKTGCPDLVIPEPNKQYHGLFIEMKREKGSTTSLEQKKWIKALNERNYLAVIAKGFNEAKLIIDNYFKGETNR